MSKATNNGLSETYKVILQEKSEVSEGDLKSFQEKAMEFGASKVLPINLKEELVFQERVKLLCANNCSHYGNKLSCPPKMPDLDYEKAIKEYKKGFVIILDREVSDFEDFERKRTESTNTLHRILLKLEKEAFNVGYPLTTSFIGGSCKLCPECSEVCKKPMLSRIPMEATGINVIETLKKFGIQLYFPTEKHKKFSRVGLLLLSK